jgi:hypothetical protein
VKFLAVVCVLAVLMPGISSAATALDQAPAAQSGEEQPPSRDAIKFTPYAPLKSLEGMSSPYIPLDSWMYPAVMRLYGMGFVDTVFLGMRPWTRLSVAHMLEASSDTITGSNNDEAIETFAALEKELAPDLRIPLDQKFGRCAIVFTWGRQTSMISDDRMRAASTAIPG